MNEREQLEMAIKVLEAQRQLLGEAVVEAALGPMREKLATLSEQPLAPHKGQERKQVTVLFADVSGFTAAAETMDPEDVTGFMNSLWARLDKAITSHGGFIDKHIGDAVMALFGTPIAQEDDPEHAVRAALSMQAELKTWRRETASSRSGQHSPVQNLQMRIGINTGGVLLGTVGTTGEYTAMGDAVNLASRLEHAAPVGGILISYDTYRHIRGLFDVIELEPLSVKGKKEPVQVYVVQGARPHSFRVTTRGVEGIETRTIGRETELAKMRSALKSVAIHHKLQLVSIVAEAGTGKSRLLYEFINWLDVQSPKVLIFKGRATKEMEKKPYALIRDLFASLFGIQESDRAAAARDKLEQGLAAFSGHTPEVAIRAHFIGHLIGLDFSASPHLAGILNDARQIRDYAFHYASQFFADATRGQIGLILLEDIHWADDGSLDLIEYLVTNQPELNLLVVGLARPTLFERRPDWGKAPIPHLRVDLNPLSAQDSRRLVAEILRKAPQIPETLLDLIVTRAEGSPFYIEELIKVLIDDRVIVRGEEEWQIDTHRLVNHKIPGTLVGLLQARLDSLSQREREILQQASIVGRVFWSDLVEHMHNPEVQPAALQAVVNENLGTLNKKELIFKHDNSVFTGTPEYIFKHAILHDVTYESVLRRLRRVYHMQAAEGLVILSGDRAEEYAGRIGEHYERADEWLTAAEWYIRAGKQAQDTYAPASAVAYYQKALEFIKEYGGPEQAPLQLDLCQRLGEVLNWQARYTEAIEIYKDMLAVAEKIADVVAQSRALQGLATSLGYAGDHTATLENALRAESLARSVNARVELAGALWMQGLAFYRKGEIRKTMALAEQVLAITTALNNQNETARSLNLLGAAHYMLGDYQQAEAEWSKALDIFQELGNRRQGMDLLSNLGVIADARGDYETAFQYYHRALEIAREVGYRDGEIVFLSNRGGEQVALKNYGAAENDLTAAIHLAGEGGSWVLANTHYYLAEAYLGQERLDEARTAALKSLALGQADDVQEHIGVAWRALGVVAERSGKPIQVIGKDEVQAVEYDPGVCSSESEKVLLEAGIEGERARTLREWARYDLKQGNKETGMKKWQEARDIFEKLDARMEVERMRNSPL